MNFNRLASQCCVGGVGGAAQNNSDHKEKEESVQMQKKLDAMLLKFFSGTSVAGDFQPDYQKALTSRKVTEIHTLLGSYRNHSISVGEGKIDRLGGFVMSPNQKALVHDCNIDTASATVENVNNLIALYRGFSGHAAGDRCSVPGSSTEQAQVTSQEHATVPLVSGGSDAAEQYVFPLTVKEKHMSVIDGFGKECLQVFGL